jgi:hypothetical protein
MRIALLALTLTLALPGWSWAQSTEDERREACTSDVFQFCAMEIPDRTRIQQCLEARRNQISPECRLVLDGGRPPRRR